MKISDLLSLSSRIRRLLRVFRSPVFKYLAVHAAFSRNALDRREYVRSSRQCDLNVINIFPIFAGRKKRKGYGYLIIAGAVMAGNFIHDTSIFLYARCDWI